MGRLETQTEPFSRMLRTLCVLTSFDEISSPKMRASPTCVLSEFVQPGFTFCLCAISPSEHLDSIRASCYVISVVGTRGGLLKPVRAKAAGRAVPPTSDAT